MLEEKAKNNEDVIVCGDDNVIRHIPPQKLPINHQRNKQIKFAYLAGIK